MRIELTRAQFALLTTPYQYPAFVGGYGSGKTQALVSRAIALKLKYTTCNIAYYMPTFDLIRTIAFPRFEQMFSELNIPYKVIKSLTPMVKVEGGGQIIMRNMDSPHRIIGFEVADSLVDELDTLKLEDAQDVWRKIMARNRQKKPDGSRNTIAVGTTPEGFRFVHKQWEKQTDALAKGYQLIRASTYSNARNLPEGYIKSLEDLYPANLIEAYLNGGFVNMASGAVYPEFSRKLNGTSEIMNATEALHIGLDFNVTKMAATLWVRRGDDPVCVGEHLNMFDTPATIELIKGRYPNRSIFVYPDASGTSRKSVGASASDIGLLQGAGFIVLKNNSNPLVKDRVLSMNVMINSKGGGRRLRINTDLAPGLTEALEQQAYDDNGEPDKASGLDHVTDSAGYFMAYRYPVVRRSVGEIEVEGR